MQIDCGGACRTVELGTSAELEVGVDLLVIGTPESMSLHHTVTKGVLSGLRSKADATEIQTDAAINPGNSGSPILDARSGRVLGILTRSWAADSEGLHFGVAIGDALRAEDRTLKRGRDRPAASEAEEGEKDCGLRGDLRDPQDEHQTDKPPLDRAHLRAQGREVVG
ncbi:MAG: serine protease [Gemmatimonadota bacterium]|nr:MAG: serine protease [Gemmatimonadota bacterium]